MHGDDGKDADGPKITSGVARALLAPARLAGIAGALMLLVILALISWSVGARYFANRPLPWADDLSGMLLVAMVGLGAAEALRRGDHIAIDILSGRAHGGLARLRDAWAAMAVLVFAVVLGWSTYGQIKFAYDFEAYTPGEVEVQSWIPMLPMLLGWALLALAALGQVVEAFWGERDR
ncbi:MAG: TRAP transporter small permease [Hyphomicrobiaceae bacterium]